MAAAVAIQGAKHALPRDHFLQPRHHRQRGFFFHQLRVIDLAGGIVENHQQVVPALVLEPAMPAAIDVQQHPRQRPALAPLAMHSPLALPRHQSRSLQRQLDPGVTQPDSVLLHQFLVKVQHIQIEVLLPIKLQHLLGQCHRNPPRRSLPPPLIKQPIVAKLLVAFPPPPHPAVADAYDLRRLPPSDPFRHRP